MDKGEEGKRDSLWKEGITAQSNPLIIPGERNFDGVKATEPVEATICIGRHRLEVCHLPRLKVIPGPVSF